MFICECATYTHIHVPTHIYTCILIHGTHTCAHTYKVWFKKSSCSCCSNSCGPNFGLSPSETPFHDCIARNALEQPYHTLGRFCPPLCDSGETQILGIFALFERWFISLFLKPGSCLPKPSLNWWSSWVSFVNVEVMSPGYVSNVFIWSVLGNDSNSSFCVAL